MTRASYATVVRGRFPTHGVKNIHAEAFRLWRSPVRLHDHVRRQGLARDLRPIALFREPRWSQALDGDSSAAIAIAVDALWDRKILDRRRDLILCVLWSCASAGDTAALLVLEMLRIRVAMRRLS